MKRTFSFFMISLLLAQGTFPLFADHPSFSREALAPSLVSSQAPPLEPKDQSRSVSVRQGASELTQRARLDQLDRQREDREVERWIDRAWKRWQADRRLAFRPERYRLGRQLFRDSREQRLKLYDEILLMASPEQEAIVRKVRAALANPRIDFMTEREVETFVFEALRRIDPQGRPWGPLIDAAHEAGLTELPWILGQSRDPSQAFFVAWKGNAVGSRLLHAAFKHKKHGGMEGLVKGAQKVRFQDPRLLVDDRKRLIEDLSGGPKKVLYILDNVLEDVFDFAAIRWMLEQGHQVSLVAKTYPANTDVSKTDLDLLLARPEVQTFFGHELLSRLKTLAAGSRREGATIQGIDLRWPSPEFLEEWTQSDVIIAKGEGNRETLLTPAGLTKGVYIFMISKDPGASGGYLPGTGIIQYVSPPQIRPIETTWRMHELSAPAGIRNALHFYLKAPDRRAEGRIVRVDPARADTFLHVDPRMLKYDFSQYSFIHPAPIGRQFRQLLGANLRKILEYHPTAVFGINGQMGNMLTSNSAVVHHGQLVRRRAPGINAERRTPLNGLFPFFVLDANQVGLQWVSIEDDLPQESLSFKEGISGPVILLDGQPTGPLPQANDPTQPHEITFDSETGSVALSAIGRDATGSILLASIGPESHSNLSGPQVSDMVELMLKAGAVEAMLLGASDDVQQFLAEERHPFFIATAARDSAVAHQFPEGRPLEVALFVSPHTLSLEGVFHLTKEMLARWRVSLAQRRFFRRATMLTAA